MRESEKGLLPHLSFTRIDRYLECPEKYRLYYLENLRPRVESGSLAFGQAIHQSLAYLFSTKGDPVSFFEKVWGDLKDFPFRYSSRDSWERLSGTGKTLLEKFVSEELPRISGIVDSESSFELAMSNIDVPLIGVIDLVADLNGSRTVVDFKTSASGYQEHDVALSDQLTVYSLAEPDAQDTALCVFVKTKEPRIEWHFAKRDKPQVVDFLRKAAYIAKEIQAGHFYKRPGSWCSWCDYLPVCVGDRQKAAESLTRIA